MAGIERRLQALESSTTPREGREVYIPRSLERLWHEQKSARQQQRGAPPLPDLEYTEEDYQDDLRTLNEFIPTMRANPGWQEEEGQAFLSEWERDVKERTEGKSA